ncbi:ABC transporter substrate-binding protein [Aquabacter sp. CN5-332]|uniref:ABC transporter substrate-binding protein n=1 Tax=Aquabacter sp. CN5-332 TaxID=3156608 RepID=UPI0032B3BC47
MRLSRRDLVRLLGCAGAFGILSKAGSARAAPQVPSCVVMDWGLAATVIALGIVPKGVPAPIWYDRCVVEPSCPPGVTNVGLLFTPNFELVQALGPDLIVIPPGLAPARALFERIAPVHAVSLYLPEADPYARADAQTRLLAERLACGEAASGLAAQAEAALREARMGLRSYDGRPLLLMSLVDERHMSVLGRQSLFQSVIDRLGLVNAGADLVPRGEMAIQGLEALQGLGDVHIIHIDPPNRRDIAAIALARPFWQALSPIRDGRFRRIPPVLGTAGLPAAIRFTHLLAQALAQGDRVG